MTNRLMLGAKDWKICLAFLSMLSFSALLSNCTTDTNSTEGTTTPVKTPEQIAKEHEKRVRVTNPRAGNINPDAQKARKKTGIKQASFLIGLYSSLDEARAVTEEIYRMKYKIRADMSKQINKMKVIAVCRYKDEAELNTIQAALKAEFGNGVKLVKEEKEEEKKK